VSDDTIDGELLVRLMRVLITEGPCTGSRLAQRVGARKAEALRILHQVGLFERVGGGRYAVWRLAGTAREPLHGHASTTLDPEVVLQLLARVQRLERLVAVLVGQGGSGPA
jgi:hypothetical protein